MIIIELLFILIIAIIMFDRDDITQTPLNDDENDN